MDITPNRGSEFWAQVPLVVECQSCWPLAGYGFKTDEKHWEAQQEHNLPDTWCDKTGLCESCEGRGIDPVPVSEVDS